VFEEAGKHVVTWRPLTKQGLHFLELPGLFAARSWPASSPRLCCTVPYVVGDRRKGAFTYPRPGAREGVGVTTIMVDSAICEHLEVRGFRFDGAFAFGLGRRYRPCYTLAGLCLYIDRLTVPYMPAASRLRLVRCDAMMKGCAPTRHPDAVGTRLPYPCRVRRRRRASAWCCFDRRVERTRPRDGPVRVAARRPPCIVVELSCSSLGKRGSRCLRCTGALPASVPSGSCRCRGCFSIVR